MQNDRLEVERLRIRDDAPPAHPPRVGALERTVLQMSRGSWLMVSHAQAKSIQRVVRQLDGTAMRYRTSTAFSVVRVLEAPWNQVTDRIAA